MREQLADGIDRSERPMLLLAALAVALYLCDLGGVWRALGVEAPYTAVAIGLDLLFLADLVLKVVVLRRSYLASPWFLVDLISALPVFSHVVGGGLLGGLRAMRAFRVLRTLRLLRVLRSLRVMRLAHSPEETPENRTFERALTVALSVYTVAFLAAMYVAHDGEFYLVLGSVMGMALIMVVQQFHVPAVASRQVRALLNVALPAQVAEHFMQNPEAYDDTVRMPATIVFSDIRGFTATVEALGGDLETLKDHLERAMDVIVDVHMKHDLIVDKFIGDAVMSFRGGNLFPGQSASDHAARVVLAVLESTRALRQLDDPYFHRIKTGGASAEDALIGTFGTSKRLSYTILGDRVNLAARLEAACNALGVVHLFCDRTHALCAEHPEIMWRRVGKLRAKGKREVVDVFEPMRREHPAPAWIAAYEQALEHFEAARFEQAVGGFREVLEHRDDEPSRLHLELCEELLRTGVDDDWLPMSEPPK